MIVHVLSKVLDCWSDAVDGTDIKINGAIDIERLQETFMMFNMREVGGLIIFVNPLTKRVLKLIKDFDSLIMGRRIPVILITDKVFEVMSGIRLNLENVDLYGVESFDNTISDVDISNIFITILARSRAVYDIPAHKESSKKKKPVSISNYDSDEDVKYVLSMEV